MLVPVLQIYNINGIGGEKVLFVNQHLFNFSLNQKKKELRNFNRALKYAVCENITGDNFVDYGNTTRQLRFICC